MNVGQTMTEKIRRSNIMKKKPLGYLGGDIMSFGSNLARQYEYNKFIEMGLPVDVYSPVQNKSINDKSNMTEEERKRFCPNNGNKRIIVLLKKLPRQILSVYGIATLLLCVLSSQPSEALPKQDVFLVGNI